MPEDINNIIKNLTLEEKAELCTGATVWRTKAIEREGIEIPSIMMTDGPHGLRKQVDEDDNLGVEGSVPATCFPTAAALASSWNRELMTKVGQALGKECQAEGVDILLGPGVNIKRSPLCGRNFEYFSEDPVLAGELAAALVRGVQSQGVGASLKHFTANNQEHNRLTVNVKLAERALREIYLPAFERVVKEAQPWTVMAAYNKVNGVYCTENSYLLNDILRGEWGFKGLVVSDWGAVDQRIEALKAGMDLEMPVNKYSKNNLVAAVKEGRLTEEFLDQAVANILRVVFRAVKKRQDNAVYDQEEHHQLAREVAAECIVLLKNKDNILPINIEENKKIAVIGSLAKNSRYQGAGSSLVNPTQLENAYQEIQQLAGDELELEYAEGYLLDNDDIDLDLIIEARKVAETSDLVVLFMGLPERYESEGFDRKDMNLPANQLQLLDEILATRDKVIVVLNNGGVVEMTPWQDRVKAILEAWLPGQGGAGAIADVLFGRANPSGRLAESIPLRLEDNPSYLNFPGKKGEVEYKEEIFVGYRYYDAKKMRVLYPFGYGLSFTSFEYTELKVSQQNLEESQDMELEVRVKVKNTGNWPGKEVVQLYVRDVECREIRPDKELKNFAKVFLNPGEVKEVCMTLNRRDFCYYEEEIKDWHLESGEFDILIAKSSREIVLSEKMYIEGSKGITRIFDRNTTVGELKNDPMGSKFIEQLVEQYIKRSRITDSNTPGALCEESLHKMLEYMPLRSLVVMSGGAFSERMMEWLLSIMNDPDSLKYKSSKWFLGMLNKLVNH